jgi:hypothetical protein
MSRIMPVQSDGRAFTSYVSSGLLEQMIQRKYNLPTEGQYRAFLQKYGMQVAQELRKLQVTKVRYSY